MAGKITIELNEMCFYAEHGLLNEEAKLGNEYNVTVKLQFDTGEKVISSIDDTINYVDVFAIVRDQMQQRKNLLETVAMEAAIQLHKKFSRIEKASISIIKTNPPITQFTGNVGVSFEVEF